VLAWSKEREGFEVLRGTALVRYLKGRPPKPCAHEPPLLLSADPAHLGESYCPGCGAYVKGHGAFKSQGRELKMRRQAEYQGRQKGSEP
jgi:hypothetical protein